MSRLGTPHEDARLRRLAHVLWWAQVVLVLAATAVGMATRVEQDVRSVSEDVEQILFHLMLLSFPLVGLVILVRQPRTTIGWVLMAVGAAWAVGLALDIYATVGLVLAPGSLPAAGVAAAASQGFWVPPVVLTGVFLVLLFPDGHLPGRRWRPVVWAAAVPMSVIPVVIAFLPGTFSEGHAAGQVNPIGLEGGQALLGVLLVVLLPLVPLTVLASAVSLVVRFRRSSGAVRQQLKWLALAGAVVALLYGVTDLVTVVSGSIVSAQGQGLLVLTFLQTASPLSFALLPVAIGVAITRHRLFDVDLVINRTLVYGALTVTLGAAYLACILMLQLALGQVTGDSDLAVAASTLAVAALFGPARSRIQSLVDRRFYRRRYDAQQTLDRFGARLRSEVDLQAVGDDLRLVVDETVQPSSVRLWLRDAS